MLGILNGAALALMTSIGHRTGLFDAMADLAPSTSEQIASAASLNERYVREWLGATVVGDIVEYDPKSETYYLPAEHAAWLTRAATPNNIAVTTQFIPLMGSVEDEIVESFKHGGGTAYASYPRFHKVMAEDSAQTVVAALTEHIFPLVPGLTERLKSGIDVLDVGCGRAMNLLARSFPNSRFSGYDFSEEAIARARAEAKEHASKNVRFEVKDAAALDEEECYDLITTFDAVHDQADPAAVLRGIAGALKEEGGVYLMQDIAGSSHAHNNLDHPLGPFLYAISTTHCMTVSLAQGGEGLGTMWGEEEAKEMLEEAGFTRVEVEQLAHDIFNNYFVATKGWPPESRRGHRHPAMPCQRRKQVERMLYTNNRTVRTRRQAEGNVLGKLPVARNTVLLSAGMAALYGMVELAAAVATTTFVAVTGLEGLAGLGPAVFLVTGALAAFPAGRAMDRLGRVPVLAAGFGLGILGCVLTGLGASLVSVVAVVGGFVLIGASTGTVMLSRAAAAEMYPPERRGRGIALVLFGAVFGALLGPLVFVPLFANEGPQGNHIAPWLGAAGFMVAGLVLVLNVRPDPKRIGLLLAPPAEKTRSPERAAPLASILRRPEVGAALLAAVAGYSVMAGTMTLVGYVLVGHGHHQGAVFPVVGAHFVGMFGLALVVGNAIDHVGRTGALVGGLLLLGLSAFSLVWAIESVAATSAALFGLGLGWNLSYVAATAELAEKTSPAERGRLLGFTDLLSGLLGAALASLGGIALATIGLVGLGVAGLTFAVAPAFWILRAASKPVRPGSRTARPGAT